MSLIWLRPMLAPILLITIGFTAALVGWHLYRSSTDNHARGNVSGAAPSNQAHAMPVIRYQNRHYQNLVTHHLNRCATLGPDE